MNEHLMVEALLMAGISGVGASSLRLLAPLIATPATVMFSGLVGSLVIALTSVLSLGIGTHNGLPFIVVFSGAVLGSSLVIDARRSQLKIGALSIVAAALVAVVVTIGIGLLVAPILTFDSWRFVEHGSSVFGDGSSIDLLLERYFGNYPVSLVSLQGLAQEAGIPFMASGLAAIGVLGVGGAFELFAPSLTGRMQNLRLSLIVLVTVALAMSAYITRLQLGYVNAHAMTAGFYALGVAAIFAPDREAPAHSIFDESVRATLLAISCAGLAMGRVEGLLLAGLMLVAAVTFRGWSRRSLRVIAAVGLAVPVLWYIRLATTLIDAEILTPSTLAALIVGVSGPLLITAFSQSDQPVPWLATMTMLALGGVTLLVALANPTGFGVSVSHVILNLISTGLWGAIWWVLVPLSVMAVWRIRLLNARGSWLVVTLGFVLVVMVLGGIRDFPYSARWGDSANRMMVHVLPAFVLMIFSGFGRTGENSRLVAVEREAHEPTELGQ